MLCFAIAGCASGPDGSALSKLPPAMGGLPADTPARPVTPASFPAVHDMPPPRTAPVLTPEQVKAAEAELSGARDRSKKQAVSPVDDK